MKEYFNSVTLAILSITGIEALHLADAEIIVKIICQLSIFGVTVYNVLKNPKPKD